MEEWVPVYGWEGLYEVSNLGRVRSNVRQGQTRLGVRNYGGGELKPITVRKGYTVVNLTKSGCREQVPVHRIVLESFISPRPYEMDACHNNGITCDNRLDNLRWDTRKGNHADKKKHGTSQCGENNGNHKYTKEQVFAVKYGGVGPKESKSMFGMTSTTYWNIRLGKTWKHL